MLIQHCSETMSIQPKRGRMTRVLWGWPQVLCLCPCSPSEQSDGGAVCVRDGVASEHRPGQKIHLALLGKQPAAGDIPHCRLGDRATVSFTAFLDRLLVSRTRQLSFLLNGVKQSGKWWAIFGAMWDHAFFYYDNAAHFRPHQVDWN